MSQTTQQEHTATTPAAPRARKDWEWFWRIVAGLMLLTVAWAAWVLYQITPRSVVTPLAYSTPVRPIGVLQSTSGASPVMPAVPKPPPTQADLALDRAQAAARSGAHQASAEVQAAGLGHQEDQTVGLRLATEISAPPPEKQGILKSQEGADAAAQGRP